MHPGQLCSVCAIQYLSTPRWCDLISLCVLPARSHSFFLSSDSPLKTKAGTSNNFCTSIPAHQPFIYLPPRQFHHHNVRLQPLPERVCVRQRDGLLRHLGCSCSSHPTRQGWSVQLPPCHQEGRPHPMAPYPWYEDLDAPASSPPKVSAVAVSSSQDDRGFTQVEGPLTFINPSSFMRNVATFRGRSALRPISAYLYVH